MTWLPTFSALTSIVMILTGSLWLKGYLRHGKRK